MEEKEREETRLEVDSILRAMEALVVSCSGGRRCHLRALHFGGAARLARQLTALPRTWLMNLLASDLFAMCQKSTRLLLRMSVSAQ